jgi:hypothetical protein
VFNAHGDCVYTKTNMALGIMFHFGRPPTTCRTVFGGATTTVSRPE